MCLVWAEVSVRDASTRNEHNVVTVLGTTADGFFLDARAHSAAAKRINMGNANRFRQRNHPMGKIQYSRLNDKKKQKTDSKRIPLHPR